MLPVFLRGWQRVGVVALLTVPLVLLTVPLMVALLVSVFLGDRQRSYVLQLVRLLAGWAKVITCAAPPG